MKSLTIAIPSMYPLLCVLTLIFFAYYKLRSEKKEIEKPVEIEPSEPIKEEPVKVKSIKVKHVPKARFSQKVDVFAVPIEGFPELESKKESFKSIRKASSSTGVPRLLIRKCCDDNIAIEHDSYLYLFSFHENNINIVK